MSLAERIFMVEFENVSIGTAVQDVFSLLTGANRGLQLHGIHLEASGISSAAELRMRLKRGTTQGSGGSAPSIVAKNPVSNGKSSTVTAHLNDTTQATGTFTTLQGFNWQLLVPFDYVMAPEDRDELDVSSSLILDLPATITATTISGQIWWSEGLIAG